MHAHRSVGNTLHYRLDATYREDQSRKRKDHGPQNKATLQQTSPNLLKGGTILKGGIQGKRLQAVWRGDNQLKVLRSPSATTLLLRRFPLNSRTIE